MNQALSTTSPTDLDDGIYYDGDQQGSLERAKFDSNDPRFWHGRNAGPDLSLGPYWLMKVSKEILSFTEDKRLDERIVETPGMPFPDVAELNDADDKSKWVEDPFTGKLVGRYSLHHCAYFVDPTTGKKVACGNSTYGQKLAVDELRDAVAIRRRILGERVFPVVRLDSTIMRTRFGKKSRPSFTIISWILDGQPVALAAPTPVAALTSAEIVDDSIPEHAR